MDFNSQLMCVNIGYGDQRVIDAIVAQLQRVAYVAPTTSTTAVRAELGRLLQEITPGNHSKAFFTNGGAEANENAIKIARWVTGRQKIIARYRSYHGATAAAITLTGDPRRWAAEPGIPGVVRAMDPYRYRCRWCGDKPACTLDCLNHIEDIITFEGPHTIAAVIVETVAGTNGLIIPPDGYMQGLRELCTRHGIMLICDEIMSGFGRTGAWFAVDHWGVVPDIMTVAKGLTSAYVPLGATIVSDEIAAQFEDRPLYAGLTYNSHPVGCAAAVACINVYQEDHLIENAKALGEVLRVELKQIKERHPSVGDVRAIGLFSLVELVKNRETREPMTPYNPKPDQLGPMPALNAYFREHGLFTFVRWNGFFVAEKAHCGALCRRRDSAQRGDSRKTALRAVETEGAHVAQLVAHECLRARDGHTQSLCLGLKGHPGDRLGRRIVLPQPDEAAPVQNRVAGQVAQPSDDLLAALTKHAPLAVRSGQQPGHIAAEMRDVVQPAGQDKAGRCRWPEGQERLAILGKQQARIIGRQRHQAERRDRRARRLRAQAREPLEVRHRGRADPAEVALGQCVVRLLQGELEIRVFQTVPASVAIALLIEPPIDGHAADCARRLQRAESQRQRGRQAALFALRAE